MIIYLYKIILPEGKGLPYPRVIMKFRFCEEGFSCSQGVHAWLRALFTHCVKKGFFI